MDLMIKPLSPELSADYLDFFDHRAFSDGYDAVEGYPVWRAQYEPLDFTGPVGLYEKAGFVRTARRGDALVMRKKLRRVKKDA